MNPRASLTDLLDIKYPIIMAPMFLVTDVVMMKAAMDAGIAACIPALNWRTPEAMEEGLKELKDYGKGSFGINLIVNKSNVYLDRQIELCAQYEVDFVITSLGKPDKVIQKCHAVGTKVFCDVVNLDHAKKVAALGADAVIAVNNRAGGHCGPESADKLIPLLVENLDIPVISAGGVATKEQLEEVINLGAIGVSVGSVFIASKEAPVTDDYKNACVDYGADDIVLTTKISGSPCTVINTDYVKSIGTKQNALEQFLNNNRRLKKYFKMFVYQRGLKSLQKAAFGATYKSVWVAGPSIEYVHDVKPISDIVARLTNETVS